MPVPTNSNPQAGHASAGGGPVPSAMPLRTTSGKIIFTTSTPGKIITVDTNA